MVLYQTPFQSYLLEVMDPITLTIITLFVLATGGATTAVVRRQKRARRLLRLRENLRARRPFGDQRLSIFDIFWDLGASDFALELLAHHQLLPEDDETEVFGAWSRLEDLIEQYGGYEGFLEDSLEAIQEFFEEHQRVGHRRRLPGLTGAARRVIPIPRRLESDSSPSTAEPASAPAPAPPSAAGIRERREARTGGRSLGLKPEMRHEEVDLDNLGKLKPLDILQSVLDGNIGDRIEQWWKMRRLRQLRDELDDALVALYQFYADTARRNPDFYAPLYDAHQRWRDEVSRLRFTSRRRPWSNTAFELAADVLFELAIDLAEHIAKRAYDTTYYTIENIHNRARNDDRAMAGYLVYLNRHAFFAGRHPGYADHARKVEYATQRVREEVIRLRNE